MREVEKERRLMERNDGVIENGEEERVGVRWLGDACEEEWTCGVCRG